MFDTVYRPALVLLAAAFEPVTLRQLDRWGVPEAELRFALYDLGDFLHVRRQAGWHDSLDPEGDREPRYAIAHEAFVRFLREGRPDWWREAHATISATALPPPGSWWSDLEPDALDGARLYDLRFVLPHLLEAGQESEHEAVLDDAGYADLCFAIGNRAADIRRDRIAMNLFDCSLTVYRHLVWEARPR